MNPRPQKRKKYLDQGTILIIKQVLLGLLIFSVIAAVIALIWYGTRISTFTIASINITGGITIDKDMVKKRAEDQLAGAYWHLIPKRFSYLYPQKKILNEVNQVERIKDVKVERTSGNELQITFAEYLPDTLWCSFSDSSTCFFLDETGYAFALAPALVGESLMRYYATEVDFNLKNRPFSQADYEATKKFTESMAGIGWYVAKIEINSARDVFYTLARGGEIKATMSDDLSKTFSNLQTIRQSKEFSHLKPGNFKYIDLRFGTKVFVNEELEVEVSSTTATTTSFSGE